MFRGVVISPPYKAISTPTQDSVIGLGQPEAGGGRESTLTEMVRDALIYWDRIDLPYNMYNTIHTISRECMVLEDEGILSSVDSTLPFEDMPDFLKTLGIDRQPVGNNKVTTLFEETVALPFLNGFRKLDAQAPGCWAMLQSWEGYAVPADLISEGRGVEIKLIDALSVPDRGVPFDTILRFRQDRAAEREALWMELNGICQRAVDSNDSARLMASELGRLDRALYNIRAVSQEAFPIRLCRTLRCSLGPMVAGASVAAGLAPALNLPVLAAAAVGAATGFRINPGLEILKGTPTIDGVSVTKTPFAYIYEADKVLR